MTIRTDFDCAIISGYLALPLGWTGAPGVFACVAEIITRRHNSPSPPKVRWAGAQPFRIHLLVGGGILIGPNDCKSIRPESRDLRQWVRGY